MRTLFKTAAAIGVTIATIAGIASRAADRSPQITGQFATVFGWLLVIAVAACAVGMLVSLVEHGIGNHPDAGTDPAIMAQLRERYPPWR